MDQINKNRGRIRAKTKQRTRESLGPANPRFQDPYHQSICPERGNSKAQTKSFLPEHKEQIKKRQRDRAEKERKTEGQPFRACRKRTQKTVEPHRETKENSHRAIVFSAVLRCTGKFPFSAFNKTFKCSMKVI